MIQEKALRIAFDIDGVVADFNKAFSELIIKHQKELKLFPDTELPVVTDKEVIKNWYWHMWYPPDAPADGKITEEQVGEVWKKLFDEHNWWMTLQPLIDIQKLVDKLQLLRAEVYFVTVRPPTAGYTPLAQSQLWLIKHGISMPNVAISSDKGVLARSLRIHLFVEDNANNAMDIATATASNTRVLLHDCPYNRHLLADERQRIYRIGKDTSTLVEEILMHSYKCAVEVGLIHDEDDEVYNSLFDDDIEEIQEQIPEEHKDGGSEAKQNEES